MVVTIDLPPEIEQDIHRNLGNLEQVVKEAMLVELYRKDKLTYRQLGEALGFCRFETDALLKKYNVTEDLPTKEEYEAALIRLGVPLH